VENGRKNFALGSRTIDFLRSGEHFLSPNFGCFEKKAVFQHPLAMALTDQIGTARIVDNQEVIRLSVCPSSAPKTVVRGETSERDLGPLCMDS
jgi:hypothetical protein